MSPACQQASECGLLARSILADWPWFVSARSAPLLPAPRSGSNVLPQTVRGSLASRWRPVSEYVCGCLKRSHSSLHILNSIDPPTYSLHGIGKLASLAWPTPRIGRSCALARSSVAPTLLFLRCSIKNGPRDQHRMGQPQRDEVQGKRFQASKTDEASADSSSIVH